MNPKKVTRILILSLCFMPVVSLAVLYFTGNFEVKELPRLGNVSEFSLTERSGDELNLAVLRGKVWVANCIFTSCRTQCPLMVRAAQKIQHSLRLKDQFRIVSVTMDPERDTPQVLAKYAVKSGADPYKWLFVTGEYDAIQRFVKDGLKLAAVEKLAADDDLVHSSKMVLVDGNGTIRGYYDSDDEAKLKQLIKDARKLLKGALSR